MNKSSCRTCYSKRRSIRYGMVGSDEFYPEVTKRNDLTILHYLALNITKHVMLCKLRLDKTYRQSRRIDRLVYLLQDIRHGAYMILMTVCYHKALDSVYILFQICYIRNHKIDAKHVLFRECKTTIHDYNRIAILDGRNIHTDLLQAAQRDHAKSLLSCLCMNCCSCQLLVTVIFICNSKTFIRSIFFIWSLACPSSVSTS